MTERASENKIVLVKRKTRLEDLIARYNTIDQAKFYIEHLGADFSDYTLEDEIYKSAITSAYRQMEQLGRVQVVDREHISNYIFGKYDIVVAVGQDGLVANTLKYLSTQLLIGVNPDPKRWDGVLLPFLVNEITSVLSDVFKGKRRSRKVTLAKAVLNDEQVLYAVNDLFIGRKTHVSARYLIELGGKSEQQSSSGIIVSTGLGSTGWFKSIAAGAFGIVQGLSSTSGIHNQQNNFDWDSQYLYYSVREPFPSKTSGTDLVFGKINRNRPLKIISQMPENGVIFSDGIEDDYLQFNSGVEATITIAEKTGHLVV